MTRALPILLVFWLLLAAPTQAASPLDYTRSTLEQARTIVASSQANNEKLTALSVLFGKFLDTDEMGKEALGQHWSSLTPAQQTEFLALFHELLERTYVQKLLLFENPDFVYVGEQRSGADAVVDTKIVTSRDQFDIRYQLRPDGAAWMATAITVEDVSLTANLGSQLNDMLSRMSVDDVLSLMRRKYGVASGAVES
ncbi:MAG TPA: ABC transporter substrate-binding protein [Candidatus Dormibacteraeota bacterium]|nr:ABC transporter substrate-binding protein [Candidatus Dormibacteraeota bacterium]